MRGRSSCIALVVGMALAPALAAAEPALTVSRTDAIDILNWDQAELRGGYSAYNLLGTEVRGPGGDPIGEVHDIMVNSRGVATAIVVEGGGVLEIGDRHYRVPWPSIRVARGAAYVEVPGSAGAGAALRRPDEWRVTELLDDAVELQGGERYGNVDDLILAPRGEVKAIVVDADASGPPGRYSFPWARERFERDRDVQRLPYERRQIEHLKPFDYSELEIPAPAKRR